MLTVGNMEIEVRIMLGLFRNGKHWKRGILDYRDFYLIFDRVPAKVRYTVRLEGEYLCYYYKGPWQGIEAAYRKLFRYATEQKLLLDDRFYEEYMVDALTSQEMEQYITRIAVKILR